MRFPISPMLVQQDLRLSHAIKLGERQVHADKKPLPVKEGAQ
jgi:hypothetical protein